MLVDHTTLDGSLPDWWTERLSAKTIEDIVQEAGQETQTPYNPETDWHDDLGCTVADWYIEFMGFDPR